MQQATVRHRVNHVNIFSDRGFIRIAAVRNMQSGQLLSTCTTIIASVALLHLSLVNEYLLQDLVHINQVLTNQFIN